MAYRFDTDLKFLKDVASEDMGDLVYCLTHDKDGQTRLTEELTMNDLYKYHYPDHNKYWELIAAEIQCFGANTFATILRGGEGVLYREVLTDVCDRMKVNYSKSANVERMEDNLLMKILEDALEKMSREEIKELGDTLGLDNTSGLTSQAMFGIFQTVFRAGGFKSYQLTVIIVNGIMKALIGNGLSVARNAALTRAMAILTGPIGWTITGLWTEVDIAGPAYRVTIPAVIQIAYLRRKHMYGKQAEKMSSGA